MALNRSIPIALCLGRSGPRDAKIFRLLGRQLGQFSADLREKQGGDLFVEVLGQGKDLPFVPGFGIPSDACTFSILSVTRHGEPVFGSLVVAAFTRRASAIFPQTRGPGVQFNRSRRRARRKNWLLSRQNSLFTRLKPAVLQTRARCFEGRRSGQRSVSDKVVAAPSPRRRSDGAAFVKQRGGVKIVGESRVPCYICSP
jgi:hypothetical protein